MRRFEYRAPRFPADVSVKLVFPDFTATGRCVQISLEGMRARFDRPLELDTSGSVVIVYRDIRLDVRVQVAHRSRDYEGLRFLFDSDAQKSSVERLVDLIIDAPPHQGLALVK